MARDESGRQEPSFKVQDRRRFSATGEAREDPPEQNAEAQAAETALPPPSTDLGNAPEGEAEISFASFVLSLSTQALVHLGEVADPIDGSTRTNLEGARQIIDILAMLNEKTAGNLDRGESSLLQNALYDLRMRYVDRSRHR